MCDLLNSGIADDHEQEQPSKRITRKSLAANIMEQSAPGGPGEPSQAEQSP